MHNLLLILIITLLAQPVFAAEEKEKNENQKTLYAIGLIMGRQLAVFNLSPSELEYVKQGLADVASGKKPEVDIAVYADKVQSLAKSRRKVYGDKMAVLNKEFLDSAAKVKNAETTKSGLVYISLQEGTGASPTPVDTVKVNYRGSLADGKEFDSSFRRGKPAEFRLGSVIQCWIEGVQKMKVGGKSKLFCPSSIAYGETGNGELIYPGAALEFEIDLLEIKQTGK